MNSTTTKYSLYSEMLSDPDAGMVFLGADSNLEHVISDAKRLVLGRRYTHLQIQDEAGTAFVRVYRPTMQDRVWVAYLLEDTVEPVNHPSEPALFDQDEPEQLKLPGMEDVR